MEKDKEKHFVAKVNKQEKNKNKRGVEEAKGISDLTRLSLSCDGGTEERDNRDTTSDSRPPSARDLGNTKK